ncbi:ABC transporter family substrate-binding protein [Pseudonocardia spinosispora]|uniref:ABC transporter family substrate-binding protein n=1 Tax=Pseudonocardia spinosispora TaxID=103441 RepID=UPI00041F3BC5|nr:ABC transporter family substrate-binding protein [Pseudonocardia spinosispora]
MNARLIVVAVAALLALAGCSGSHRLPPPSGAGAGAGVSDIGVKPRDEVRDGGDLRWPLDRMPDNFNYLQFSGATEQTASVVRAVLPTLFSGTASGGTRINPDYLTSASVTSTTPQTVTYWINPKAVWSNGTPITWHDFDAQWRALNGSDPAYQAAGQTGYRDIASVQPGTDNKQVIVTFSRTYAEWKGLFSPLYPAAANSDPALFNSGWINRMPYTAGPFQLDSINPATKTITLKRSDNWWGAPAKLNRIIFRVLDRGALPDALAANQIDFYKIGSSVDLLKRAQSLPGITIRQSPDREYNQITFNGSPGSVMADQALRQAIAKGIDRVAIATQLVGQIVPNPQADGNHIYAFGSRRYRDNSDVLPFNTVAAGQELDALGWVQNAPNAIRIKNGRPLRLQLVEGTPDPVSEQINELVRTQLRQIGVDVYIRQVPLTQLSNQYRAGDFDLTTFAWQNGSTPFSSSRGLYAKPDGRNVQQNYGRIYSPEIDALYSQGLAELDDGKRASIANRIDRLIWAEVHHLPLYPSTGTYAVRSNLANFGAPGFADVDYINAGYLK